MSEFLQQLVNGVTWGSVYALIALGYTMVYGILRLINFAHGDIYMLGAFIGLYTSNWLRAGEAPSPAKAIAVLLTSMAACALIGMLIERLAYKPVRRSPRLSALITAIGVSLLLENGGALLFGADPKFFPQLIPSHNIALGMGVTLSNQQLIVLVVSVVLMTLLRLLVLHTRVGKAMQAVSHNHMAASLMGISVDRIITFTFMIGSALAAAAGVLVALQSPKIEPYMGIMPGLKAFVAAVLGGIGNIPGAVVGGLVMGVAEVLVTGYLSPTYRDAIAFVLLIVILLVRPAGIFGKAVTEKV
ncbi:MAG TPA: branched-chain amino acid ABC transporter permease [Candidatus Acidoferrales bacterium]|nr:branched-chain amino acid ABC transporter permease [Candidatus Acidoferrales bacterium]